MFEETLKLILGLDQRQPIEILPERLDELFSRLAGAPADAMHVIEDEIWEIWTSYPDPVIAGRMNEAIAAIAGKRYAEAKNLLDDLVREAPLWPEAWNKRATLLFLQGKDAESVRDINRTLSLEPRHFGALSGFAQICLRRGDAAAALIALETALRINPHLTAVRIAADEIKRLRPQTLH